MIETICRHFLSPLGERKIMNHFVIRMSFVKCCIQNLPKLRKLLNIVASQFGCQLSRAFI
jgi:hypothetical protein